MTHHPHVTTNNPLHKRPLWLVPALGLVLAFGCGEAEADPSSPSSRPSGPEESSPRLAAPSPAVRPAELEASPPSSLEEPTVLTSAAAIPPMEAEGSGRDTLAPDDEPQTGLVEVRRFLVARRIEAREPVDPADEFPYLDAPMYAFVDAANPEDQAETLSITFLSPEGREVGFIDLSIPANAPRWRTWARSRLVTTPGEWVAEARDSEGQLVARRRFRID